MRLLLAVTIVLGLCVGAANVTAQEEEGEVKIDPTGQPYWEGFDSGSGIRPVTSCSGPMGSLDAGLMLLPMAALGILLAAHRLQYPKAKPVCWRTLWLGAGVTCLTEGCKGAEICEVCAK